MNYSDRPDNLIDYPVRSDGTPALNNDQLKQRLMQEMLDASPSVWRNVIMTNSEGVQFDFEVGNFGDITTGTITTDTIYTSTDTTSWVITTFEELGADPPTQPDFVGFDEELEALPPTEVSTGHGCFESSSPLRAEDEDDTMGSEHDPGTVGSAEMWFRNLRGDEEAPAVGTFAQPVMDRCPDCGAPGGDMVPCGGPPPEPEEDDACPVPF